MCHYTVQSICDHCRPECLIIALVNSDVSRARMNYELLAGSFMYDQYEYVV